MLTIDEVQKIALLARIELREGEAEKFQKELSQVLEYVEQLKQVDTEGLAEVSQVTGLENVQRMDEVIESESIDAILAVAPDSKDRFYKVKAIL